MAMQHTDQQPIFNFWCTSDADINLAKDLLAGIDQSEISYSLLQRENGGLRLKEVSENLKMFFQNDPPLFEKPEDIFYNLVSQKPGGLGTYAEVKLNHALVKNDMLSRTFSRHRNIGKAFSQANYGPTYTDAYVKYIEHIKHSIDVANQRPILVGPNKEDILFYCRDHRDDLFAVPRNISIDLTRRCNKRCPKCFHDGLRLKKEIQETDMDIELAVHLLEQCAQMSPKPTIHPFISGEPFVYPHLRTFLKKASDLDLAVSFTTNAQLMTEDDMDMLINNTCIGFLCISLDTMDSDRYELLQPPGPLDKVIDNIHCLFEKADMADRDIKKQITYVFDDNNSDEFESFKDYWMKYADIVVKSMKLNFEKDNSPYKMVEQSLYQEIPCTVLHQGFRILPDGNVSMPCLLDYNGDPELNMNNLSIMEAWNSKKATQWREMLLDGTSPQVEEYCKKCTGCGRYFGHYMTNDGIHILYSHVSEQYMHSF